MQKYCIIVTLPVIIFFSFRSVSTFLTQKREGFNCVIEWVRARPEKCREVNLPVNTSAAV